MARFRSIRWKTLLALSLIVIVLPGWSKATDLERETSLKLAPTDVDFYYSSLRLQEQLKSFLSSKVVMELRNVGVVQKLIATAKEQWESGEGEIGQAKPYLDNPNVQSVLALLQDMCSSEVFVFGDSRFSTLAIEMKKFQDNMVRNGRNGDPEAMIEWLKGLDASDFKDIRLPTLVMGFRVQNSERALTHLDQLEGIARFGLASMPALAPFSRALQRNEDSRGTHLSLSLSGKMIPWDSIPRSGDPERDSLIDQFEEIFNDRQLVVTVGQLDGYVVLAMSEEKDAVSKLGRSGTLLSHPYLQPLKAKASQDITSISYVSDRLSDANYKANLEGYFTKIYMQMRPMLELVNDGELPEFLEPLEDDCKWLDDQVRMLLPQFKGQLGFAFSSSTGSEGYLYSHTKSVNLNAKERLDILQHVGGKPLAMVAYRQAYHPEYIALFRKVVQKVRSYAVEYRESDQFEDDFADEADKEKFDLLLTKGYPLVVELFDVIEKKFTPALKDGQNAIVLTYGNIESKQYIPEMPAADELLPLPEFATVASVSNREQLVDGYVDLFNILDDVVDLVREFDANAIPAAYKIPRPTQANISGGEKFFYPIPDDCPVPKSMAPQVSFQDKWAFHTYSDKLTESLIDRKPLGVGGQTIDLNKSLGAAAYFDFGGIVRMLTPWVRYGLLLHNDDLNQMLLPPERAFPGITGKDVLQAWTALGFLGNVASSTESIDDGGSVTHWVYSKGGSR